MRGLAVGTVSGFRLWRQSASSSTGRREFLWPTCSRRTRNRCKSHWYPP